VSPPPPHRAAIAWRGATWAALLNAIGAPLLLVVDRSLHLPPAPPLISAGAGLLLAALLTARRDHPTRAGAAAAFLTNTAVLVWMLWVTNGHAAQLGARWAPFQTNKLGALTVGLLTPELGVGLASLAAYGGSAVLQWALFPQAVRDQLASGEPAATAIFTLFGALLLVESTRRLALQRRLLQRDHEAAEIRRRAEVLLAVRDLANTPLQTIALTAASLRARHPDLAPQLARLERALQRLDELNRALAAHERMAQWPVGSESFDPLSVLRGPPG
jgi:hypothetical protein